MGEDIRHACGIAGVFNVPDASFYTATALEVLQHRGQESVGIVSYGKRQAGEARFFERLRMGSVAEQIKPRHIRNELFGSAAIGHVRYSTTGESNNTNIQPLRFYSSRFNKHIYIAHNGNLVNTKQVLRDIGSVMLHTTTDSEIIAHRIARSKADNLKDCVKDALQSFEGAYSLLIFTNDMLIAARDPHGWKPLCVGRMGKGYIAASETCALDAVRAEFLFDVEPGELVMFHSNQMHREKFSEVTQFRGNKGATCIFEYIYFARPDSKIDGTLVASWRIELGRETARESPVEADLVMPIPDSANFQAHGFSHETGIPLLPAYVRNHTKRTFILPGQDLRQDSADRKLNLIKEFVQEKRVVLIDDSIVRGTTMRDRVKMLKDAGATEVHVRICCPPHRFPCYYGIDFPKREELVAHGRTIEEIRKIIGADSLAYLSQAGLENVASSIKLGKCYACFTGDYPQPPKELILRIKK